MKRIVTVSALLILSASIFSEDKSKEPFSLVGKANDMNSHMAQIYMERAKMRKERGDIDTANADYEKAIQFDPKLAEGNTQFSIRVDAKEWLKKADNAIYVPDKIACYQKAIKLDPKCTEAYFYLGKCQYKENHFKEAAETFRALLEIDPKYSGAERYLKKAEKKLKN